MVLNRNLVLHIVAILLLIIASLPLRYIDLGYSEYQDDEKKAFIRLGADENIFEFFLRQRKGPMQFLVSYVPYAFTSDYRNEFAERLPFATLNICSVVVLYLLLYKITGNKLASLFGGLIYATNGFIVGFSRIAQYQNLNLLFSILSLYFYIDLTKSNTHLTKKSLLGTLFFSLSLLSHWDAVFYLVPTIYFVVVFLRRKDLGREFKRKLLLYNFTAGCLFLLPFLLPYILAQTTNVQNALYLTRRVGLNTVDLSKHKFIFELYNPYITLYLYTVFALLSLIIIRRQFIYIGWFIINLLLILYFMAKPGTHIYNYVIPLFFMFAVMASYLLNKVSIYTRVLFTIMMFSVYGAFAYQSYLLFVDHSQEYPWEAKKVFGNTTTPYYEKEVLTFGFPHFRDWKNINDFLQNYNNTCGYITNEGKEISQIYIDLKYGETTGCYYIISVKKPFISTRDGVTFHGATKKIYQYEARGNPLTRVYARRL
jgi:hypothetical protein